MVLVDEDLGTALRRRRRQLGLTQEQAGAHFNVHQTMFGQWENGKKRPGPERLSALATFLDLTEPEAAEMLLGFHDDEVASLRDEVAELRDQVQALRLSVDESRRDVAELTRLLGEPPH